MIFATLTGNINIALNVLTVAVVVLAGIFATRSKIKNDNYEDLKERVRILEGERIEARKQHIDNQKAIANLEGQLQTYKEIPLRELAEGIKEVVAVSKQNAESNAKILAQLESSATKLTKINKSTAVKVQVVADKLEQK